MKYSKPTPKPEVEMRNKIPYCTTCNQPLILKGIMAGSCGCFPEYKNPYQVTLQPETQTLLVDSWNEIKGVTV